MRVWSVRSGACFFRLVFERASEAIFFNFGSILGGFGRPKRRPKSSFGRSFVDVFSECVSASFFCGNWEGSDVEKSIKTIVFPMVFANFQKIDVFEKVAKKPRFWSRFRRPKP